MKSSRAFLCGLTFLYIGSRVLAAANVAVTTPPVYVPNLSHAAGPLPEGILAWDATSKETNVVANTRQAHFIFDFTNIATEVQATLMTNITTVTNFATATKSGLWARWFEKKAKRIPQMTKVTNIMTKSLVRPVPVTILSVRPSCGCTTTKLPALPWTLAPGAHGQIEATVNLYVATGTLYKTLMVYTDRGTKTLMLKITVLPFQMPAMSEAEREKNRKLAAADRQLVFKGQCATCHVQQGQGKYGEALYQADCAICHDSEHRATMVPDLHALKTPTNFEFWRTWIAQGKPDSLMPAFSTVGGGPLSDMQINSLASYLTATIPSKALSKNN